jgi:hypothetical protein
MLGLVPGIHDFAASDIVKDVDGRDKPGHDENYWQLSGTRAGSVSYFM